MIPFNSVPQRNRQHTPSERQEILSSNRFPVSWSCASTLQQGQDLNAEFEWPLRLCARKSVNNLCLNHWILPINVDSCAPPQTSQVRILGNRPRNLLLFKPSFQRVWAANKTNFWSSVMSLWNEDGKKTCFSSRITLGWSWWSRDPWPCHTASNLILALTMNACLLFGFQVARLSRVKKQANPFCEMCCPSSSDEYNQKYYNQMCYNQNSMATEQLELAV